MYITKSGPWENYGFREGSRLHGGKLHVKWNETESKWLNWHVENCELYHKYVIGQFCAL